VLHGHNYFKFRNIPLAFFSFLSKENLFWLGEKTKEEKNMLLGLISDTHDHLPLVEKAIKRLNAEKVDLVLHAGDYTSPFTIPKFKALCCRLIGVFGNNDGDHELLKKRFNENVNCEVRGRFAQVDAKGFKIALLHGDETELQNALVNCQGFDAVVSGHTHVSVNRVSGKTLVVCPGEVCGYLYGKPTLALLDTAERKTTIIEL
jgi:putative phosphoesterase